jgi:hypothetical protein
VTRTTPNIGDVVQFALPDGRYAHGRVLRDASIAFYRDMTNKPAEPPIGSRDFQVVVGVYDDVLGSPDGHDPSQDPVEDSPPPSCIRDPITGDVSIYYQGETRAATDAECEGRTRRSGIYQHLVERLQKAPSEVN